MRKDILGRRGPESRGLELAKSQAALWEVGSSCTESR